MSGNQQPGAGLGLDDNRRIDVENAKGEDLRKQDVLFKSVDGPPNNGVSADFLYSEGYLNAARILSNHVCNHEHRQDILIFPIAFLYRHHVELSLKDLVRVAHYLVAGQKPAGGSHPLIPLWEELKKLLADLGELPPTADLEGLEAYINQLETVDKQSQAFRYPKSRKGQPHLSGFGGIDVRNLAEGMERLAGYLNGISARLDVLSDHKAEMLSYKEEVETNSQP
jgi:hypothetical protein